MRDNDIVLLDCTMRDGGYYNNWDFPTELVDEYLGAMNAIGADYVELGFRSCKSDGFKGGCAYTSDAFIAQLSIPAGLKIGVMLNGSEVIGDSEAILKKLKVLFAPASASRVKLVRLACHAHEVSGVGMAISWLKNEGYDVALNLMQIANRSPEEIEEIANKVSNYPLRVLYFADSTGSLDPERTKSIITSLRKKWDGPLGIHTHDNMGLAISNSMAAIDCGLSWIDSTVTGMGRGPGNAKTEILVLAVDEMRSKSIKITPLLGLIRKYFAPMQMRYGWGSNTYYYLAGKYGIHPSYIQEMLNDSRYSEEDMLAIIEHLKGEGGKKFNLTKLEAARNFFHGEPCGSWCPEVLIGGRDVMIIGTGPGAQKHRIALEDFIRERNPFVIALNTHQSISEEMIDIRAACHPVRLLADCDNYSQLPQPLVTPKSMLPESVLLALKGKEVLDFGILFSSDGFEFHPSFAQLPSLLVLAYALSIATSGKGKKVYLVGFDGYGADDPRHGEIDRLFKQYSSSDGALPFVSLTSTRYDIPTSSVYAPFFKAEL